MVALLHLNGIGTRKVDKLPKLAIKDNTGIENGDIIVRFPGHSRTTKKYFSRTFQDKI